MATTRLLRRMNAQRVLDALRASGPLRVTELVAATELSRPTVDAVADELVALGWLSEVAAVEGARGRPARSLAFRADAGFVLGVDIGEVKVRCAVADLLGRVVVERVREFDGEDRLPVIRSEVAALGVDNLLFACVGCTGAMDRTRGTVLFSSVFDDDFDLAGAIDLACPVVIENDCNLAVLAERWCGAAVGLEDVVCVLAGERIGAGIMVGGSLMRGHEGAAGELAFLGAFEEEHGARGIGQLVRELSGQAPEAVFAAAGAGDRKALAIVERAERWAGHGIVTTAQLVNPEVVVIGGGVARAGEVLLAPLRDRLQRMVRRPPRLEASPLAERGPLLGAIRLALDELEPLLLEGLAEAA
ncbi:ROK family transcriptional regulator [Solirubrobacter soli]|uniref:ROK family transcriptional regulator n=1 Tax=Solirubrobacter soli TaxID=363832 RepID=UPI0003FFBBD0|nr:ROK family transcriptional regulator [Solirubrobacter soli]